MSFESGTPWNGQQDAQTTVTGADDLQKAKAAEAAAQSQTQSQQQVYVDNNTQQQTKSTAPEFCHLVSLLSKLETQASMTEEGRKYFDKIRAALEDSAWGYKIKCMRLTNPPEGFLFYSETTKVGIVLVFTENIIPSDDEEGLTRLYGVARASAINVMGGPSGGFRVINVIGVGPEDYTKADVMVTDLKNCFIADTDQQFIDLTVDAIDKLRISISMNADKVQTFINANSPHGVPAAMDYGFTIDVVTQKDRYGNFYIENNNFKREYETKTIAAITGKTNFLANPIINGYGMNFGPQPMMGQQMQHLFMPVVTITDIVSTVKSQYLLPLFLTMAYQVFIGAGLWKQPYKQFGKANSVNIGNLLENQQTHQLLEMNNDVEVENFIASYCAFPILCLSVTEGRSRIPGLEWFSDENMSVHAINAFNGFFKQNTLNSDPVFMRYAEYTGPVTYSGMLIDSRNLDYLRIVASNPNEAPNVRNMMMLQKDPGYKTKIVKQVSPDYRTKYIVMNCPLKQGFLSDLSALLRSHIQVQMDAHAGGPNYMNLSSFLSESNAYATSNINMMNGPSLNSYYDYNNFFSYMNNNRF